MLIAFPAKINESSAKVSVAGLGISIHSRFDTRPKSACTTAPEGNCAFFTSEHMGGVLPPPAFVTEHGRGCNPAPTRDG